ncbi:MAG: sulfotransferase [Thiohalospira sp.]
MKRSEKRTENFKPNENLDALITELKALLEPVQLQIQNNFTNNEYPFLFIVGNPRSGSTLLLQWMASLGIFSYPTNFLNRFAYAPYIGAQIQKLLFDKKFDLNDEFKDLMSGISFESNLGKTSGALSVNEFQHFFRNYMDNFEPQYLPDNDIEKIDFNKIKSGLASIESAFQKPFVVKLVMLQFNLDVFYKYIPKSIFIHIKREPLYNMQSLLLAREKYYGDKNIWWSVKPKEYDKLRELDVFTQIAGQVFYTNKAIENGLENIPEEKKVVIQYEDFCRNPKTYFNEIINKYKSLGFDITHEYKGVKSFNNTNVSKLEKEEIDKLKEAYNFFEGNNE